MKNDDAKRDGQLTTGRHLRSIETSISGDDACTCPAIATDIRQPTCSEFRDAFSDTVSRFTSAGMVYFVSSVGTVSEAADVACTGTTTTRKTGVFLASGMNGEVC